LFLCCFVLFCVGVLVLRREEEEEEERNDITAEFEQGY